MVLFNKNYVLKYRLICNTKQHHINKCSIIMFASNNYVEYSREILFHAYILPQVLYISKIRLKSLTEDF